MNIINPSVEVLTHINGVEILKHIERCGRVCYKSEDKITDDSCQKFVQNIMARGHEAVLEHYNITAKFICDRGVSHEIVRHRLASYCQESTRYCNYQKDGFGKEITVVKPSYLDESSREYFSWHQACLCAEEEYMNMLSEGRSPQEARSVLPNSLKTEVIMTTNLREWRHFFKLRTAKAAHPQMREVAIMLFNIFHAQIPVLFDDIEVNN